MNPIRKRRGVKEAGLWVHEIVSISGEWRCLRRACASERLYVGANIFVSSCRNIPQRSVSNTVYTAAGSLMDDLWGSRLPQPRSNRCRSKRPTASLLAVPPMRWRSTLKAVVAAQLSVIDAGWDVKKCRRRVLLQKELLTVVDSRQNVEDTASCM